MIKRTTAIAIDRPAANASRPPRQWTPLIFCFLAALFLSHEAPGQETIRTFRDSGNPGLGSLKKVKVLLIGDSMTVGDFGAELQDYLTKRFTRDAVAVYGSCGSSPEHWLRGEPEYLSKCGYREYTPKTEIIYDFGSGKPPQPALAPKLEDLVEIFDPYVVIVQQGTNWMDGMPENLVIPNSGYSHTMDRLVAAIRENGNTGRQIVWITPPDSSKYSAAVKTKVFDIIKSASDRDAFQIIDSRPMTHYVPGQSGSDGVHYNGKEAKSWAAQVERDLNQLISHIK